MRSKATLIYAIVGGAALAVAPAVMAAHYQLEYAFHGSPSDACNPRSDLTKYEGKIYGMAPGGSLGGVAFSIDPDTGAENILHEFKGPEPYNNGFISVDGKFYGETWGGGRNLSGTAFSMDPKSGKTTVLYDFQDGADGGYPTGDLIAVGGLLYGTTVEGGHNAGTVFSINPLTGAESVVYAFGSNSDIDGYFTTGDLVRVGGLLYGTTMWGGSSNLCAYGCGTVFRVDPKTGVETVLHSFTGGADGEFPGPLTKVDGKFYGTLGTNGLPNGCCGAIFTLDPETGIESIVYTFENESDGSGPVGRLTKMGRSLFGVTQGGGVHGNGVIFSLNLDDGAESVLHDFRGHNDGAVPLAGLMPTRNVLFGMTSSGGGSGNCGTVFSIRP